MKSIILAIALALGTLLALAEEPKQTVKVCVDVKDKAGQTVIDPKRLSIYTPLTHRTKRHDVADHESDPADRLRITLSGIRSLIGSLR